MMEYQIERLKHFLFKCGDRREEQNLYLNKAESRTDRKSTRLNSSH